MPELEQYLNYLNNNQYSSQDIFYKLMEKSRNDKELEHLLYQLPSATIEERNNLVKQYLNKNKQQEKEEEVIAEIFNIDTSLIKHLELKNGKEVFTFYHPILLKQIVLENKQTKNLKEQLKKYQEEHPDIDDNLQMLNEQRLNNGELQFVPVEKVDNYKFLINKLTKEEQQALDYLLKNKDSYEISSVNIENVLGLDKKGQIIESYLDIKNMEFRIEKPKEDVYSQDEQTSLKETNEKDSKINNTVNNISEDNKDISLDEVNNEENLDIDKQLEAEGLDKDKIAFIKDKLELYDQYPELLNYLTEEDFKFYQKYLNIYRKNKEQQKEKGYQKQYKMETGYADVLILSLITSFFGGMFITILLALIQYK